jgi:hypothetical protein
MSLQHLLFALISLILVESRIKEGDLTISVLSHLPIASSEATDPWVVL